MFAGAILQSFAKNIETFIGARGMRKSRLGRECYVELTPLPSWLWAYFRTKRRAAANYRISLSDAGGSSCDRFLRYQLTRNPVISVASLLLCTTRRGTWAVSSVRILWDYLLSKVYINWILHSRMGSFWGVQRRGIVKLVMANSHDRSSPRTPPADSTRVVSNPVPVNSHIRLNSMQVHSRKPAIFSC